MRRPVKTGLAALAVLLCCALPASAATPRASFNDVEDEVMCVTCNVPLNIAESPQADTERDLIRTLIAQGLTKQQIKDKLVIEYTENVLADPPTDGFNVTTWLVPIGAIGGVALLLLLALPKWRRKTRDAPSTPDAGPALSSDELKRLDDDLAATEI